LKSDRTVPAFDESTKTDKRLTVQPRSARTVFALVWAAAVLMLGGAIISGNIGFAQPLMIASGLVLGVLLAVTLIRSLPGISFAGLPFHISAWRFAGIVLVAWVVLYGSTLLIPIPWSLLVLAAAALLSVVALRTLGSRREIANASGLAVVAGIAGLGAGHNAQWLPLWQWGLLQVPLTFFGLLTGWGLARRLGLFDQGIGRVHLLVAGPRRAIRAALEGMALGVPFALLGVVLGSTSSESWARHWWAPLIAIQPAISEEAYARVFLIGLMIFVFLRLRTGTLRAAWLGAIMVGVYWFAAIHAKPWDVSSTLLLGTLFNLPLTFVWMRRGLESAMGFHFAVDGIRWLAVFLVATGILPR
jgi:hypothetical protein